MDKVSFGHEQVSPEEKTRRVRGVFSSVAASYDVMNDLMSGGQHRLWKDRFVRLVRPRAGEAILDMAGGTGDIAFRMARRGARVTVVSTVKSQPPMASDDLRRQADSFVDLADLSDIIGRPSRLPRFIQESRSERQHEDEPEADAEA